MSLSMQKSKNIKEITKSIIKNKKLNDKQKMQQKGLASMQKQVINKKEQLTYFLNMIEDISLENYQQNVLRIIRNSNHNQPRIITNAQQDLEQQNIIKQPNEIICPICLDYVVSASITVCGHTFCEQCIEEALLKFNGCPICRSPIRQSHQTYCKTLDFYIHKFIETLEQQEQKYFLQRQQKHLEWKKSIKVEDFKIGLVIDVRDTEFIWCQGKILKIEYQRNNKAIFLVHYEGWNKIFDEYFPEDSSRIAPVGVFTNRQDIPKYKLQNNIHIHPNNQNNHSTFFNNISNSQHQFLGSLIQQLSNLPNHAANADSNSNNQQSQEQASAQINANQTNQIQVNHDEILLPLQSLPRNLSNRLTVRFIGRIQEFQNLN